MGDLLQQTLMAQTVGTVLEDNSPWTRAFYRSTGSLLPVNTNLSLELTGTTAKLTSQANDAYALYRAEASPTVSRLNNTVRAKIKYSRGTNGWIEAGITLRAKLFDDSDPNDTERPYRIYILDSDVTYASFDNTRYNRNQHRENFVEPGQYLVIDRIVDIPDTVGPGASIQRQRAREFYYKKLSDLGIDDVVEGEFFTLEGIIATRTTFLGTRVFIECRINNRKVTAVLDGLADRLEADEFYIGGFHAFTRRTGGTTTRTIEYESFEYFDLATTPAQPAVPPIPVCEPPPSFRTPVVRSQTTVGGEGTAVGTFPVIPSFVFTATERFLTRTTSSDGGYDTTHPKFSDGRAIYGAIFKNLTTTDKDSIASFIDSHSGGLDAFTFTIPDTLGTIKARMVDSSLDITQAGPQTWNISMFIEELR